ncbi:hypothetical protein [Clostridium perfringens]|uniref:hypothetical protein n=1 Tax=Clostridium perfringens TaxID=1502 RepID=UPI0039ECC989
MENKEQSKAIRKTYFCNSQTNDFIKEYSSRMGISESAFVNICINQYYMQVKTIDSFETFQKILDKLDKLDGNFKDLKQLSNVD